MGITYIRVVSHGMRGLCTRVERFSSPRLIEINRIERLDVCDVIQALKE